jgi:long-chain fatty acid transport protein
MIKKIPLPLITCILLCMNTLDATSGYFLHGWSAKSSAMGGVGAAYPQDSIIASVNPAGMYWVGNRSDAGLIFLNPVRRYEYTGTPGSIDGGNVRSGQDLFFVPFGGYNTYYNKCLSYGISVWGNGGTNTNYSKNNPVFGTGSLGVDYAQFVAAPTVAYRFFKDHSIGLSPLFGFQRICVYGLQNFSAFSSRPGRVSNNAYSQSWGLGARIGWMGQICNGVWLGASYSTKIYMTKLHAYTGLLANNAKFDIPANWTVGFKCKINSKTNIAFDYVRLLYKTSRPISQCIERIFTYPLGTKEGGGFGWNDISVYKVGLDYQWNPCITLRCGYAGNPVPYNSSQIDPNIIAPAVIKHHLNIGFTYCFCRCYELDFAYMHALHNSISGESIFGLGTVKHHMHQNSWTLQLGRKY